MKKKVKINCDNRDLILRIMREISGEEAIYHPLPDFSYSAGGFTLTRNGSIETESEDMRLFRTLSSLGMCDYPRPEPFPEGRDFVFPTADHSAVPLINILSIISSRQDQMNRALSSGGAFFVSPRLMNDILDHPPGTVPEFLQALYGREKEYGGISFFLSHFELNGFLTCHPEERDIHRQLADLMVRTALTRRRLKAFTPRVRNQKYAFRTWLCSVGMIGDEYERARTILLSRLYGRTNTKKLYSRGGNK